MKTREQVIEELKSAGLWNEDAVKSMRPDFVEAALDFFRFTEEKCRIEKEQKEKELYESMARMMDNPHTQNATASSSQKIVIGRLTKGMETM